MSKFYDAEFLKKYDYFKMRALIRIGALVEGEAVLYCPVDTGNLRNSLNYKVNEKDSYVDIGTNVEYALDVEKGGKNPKKPNKKIPFLTPAGENNIMRIENIVKDEMGNIK